MRQYQQGFTLIEMVATMVILSIVGVVTIGIIRSGAQIFADVTGRDQIVSQSRFVLERMNRDLRNALPNSIRVAGNGTRHCIEFVPIRWSTYYFDIPTTGEALTTTISVVQLTTPIDSYSFELSHQVVVFPEDENAIYNPVGNRRHRFELTGAANGITNQSDLTLDISGNQRFAEDSNARRIYIVDEPVSYCVQNTRITRHANYGFSNIQSTSVNDLNVNSAGVPVPEVLMAEGITNILSNNPNNTNLNDDDPFRVIEASFRRNAFIHLRLRFARPDDPDETVIFNSEVHIPNVP